MRVPHPFSRSLTLLFSLGILSFWFMAGSGFALEGWEGENPKWYQCKTTRDCTIERTPCHNPVGVNRAHLNAYRSWQQENARRVNCSEGKWPKTVCLQCEKSKCTVTAPNSK